MTIDEASRQYCIPIKILREYESWGLCGAVKKVMGVWQYDDTDIERLSTIVTLHDMDYLSKGGDLYAAPAGTGGYRPDPPAPTRECPPGTASA